MKLIWKKYNNRKMLDEDDRSQNRLGGFDLSIKFKIWQQIFTSVMTKSATYFE